MADFLIARSAVAAYAELSRDFNPLHINALAAAQSPLGQLSPHGFLLLGEAFDAMHGLLAGSRELYVVFRAPGMVDAMMRAEVGPLTDDARSFAITDADAGVLAEGRIRSIGLQ